MNIYYQLIVISFIIFEIVKLSSGQTIPRQHHPPPRTTGAQPPPQGGAGNYPPRSPRNQAIHQRVAQDPFSPPMLPTYQSYPHAQANVPPPPPPTTQRGPIRPPPTTQTFHRPPPPPPAPSLTGGPPISPNFGSPIPTGRARASTPPPIAQMGMMPDQYEMGMSGSLQGGPGLGGPPPLPMSLSSIQNKQPTIKRPTRKPMPAPPMAGAPSSTRGIPPPSMPQQSAYAQQQYQQQPQYQQQQYNQYAQQQQPQQQQPGGIGGIGGVGSMGGLGIGPAMLVGAGDHDFDYDYDYDYDFDFDYDYDFDFDFDFDYDGQLAGFTNETTNKTHIEIKIDSVQHEFNTTTTPDKNVTAIDEVEIPKGDRLADQKQLKRKQTKLSAKEMAIIRAADHADQEPPDAPIDQITVIDGEIIDGETLPPDTFTTTQDYNQTIIETSTVVDNQLVDQQTVLVVDGETQNPDPGLIDGELVIDATLMP